MQTNTGIHIGKNSRDIEEYGTSAFPAAAYEVCLRKTPLGFYDAHWHNRLHIMRALPGSSIRVTTDTKHYDLHDADAIFLNNGTLHSVYPVQSRESIFQIILFDRRLISSFSGSGIERDLVLPMSSFNEILLRADNVAHADMLTHIQKGFSAFFSPAPTHEMAFCVEMMTLWRILVDGNFFEPSFAAPLGSDRAKAMLSFISNRYNSDLTLDEITGAANICRSQGSKYFKDYVGKTIFEYLLHYRIEKSIDLLMKTDHTISHIAYETGFCSASHYIERFKQVIGCSPGDYRNRA